MLNVNNLACRRGGREVFRDVTFALGDGEVLLVTGANGSGKSSLLRVLAGLLEPSRGDVIWQGQNIAAQDNYTQHIHYVGHLDAVKNELTVGEMMDYRVALYGIAPRMDLAQDPFQLKMLREKPVRYLSAGQKRRLSLSRLVVSESRLWLLDEPTTALDQNGQEMLAMCIARHRAAGGMAIIATHMDMQLPDARSYDMQARS
jgi:heme exporter protein A